MTSQKQLLANQQNARKSTGPRSNEGKQHSRANSLKHGLTGEGLVFERQAAAELDAKRREFAEYVRPGNPVEDSLVERLALSKVRMEHCRRAELARLATLERRAVRRFARRQERQFGQALADFEADCSAGLLRLREGSAGCKYLAAEWEALASVLESQGHWDEEHLARVKQLCGMPEYPRVADADLLSRLKDYNIVARGGDVPADDQLEPAEARDALLGFVAGEVDELTQRAQALREQYDEPERSEAIDSVRVDTSPEGMRLARYDVMNEMTFHRSFRALRALRKGDPEALGFAPGEYAEPPAQNEPISETQPSAREMFCDDESEAQTASTAPFPSAEAPSFPPPETLAPSFGAFLATPDVPMGALARA